MCLNENTAYMPSVNAIQIKSSAMNESIRMNEWSDYATSAKMKRNLAFSLFCCSLKNQNSIIVSGCATKNQTLANVFFFFQRMFTVLNKEIVYISQAYFHWAFVERWTTHNIIDGIEHNTQ